MQQVKLMRRNRDHVARIKIASGADLPDIIAWNGRLFRRLPAAGPPDAMPEYVEAYGYVHHEGVCERSALTGERGA